MLIEYVLFLQLFVIGLMSALHCVSMCGGIMGALSLSLPPYVQARPALLAGYVALFNLGRLTAYVAMAATAGAVGSGMLGLLPPAGASWAAKLLLAASLVMVGLHLTGALPRLAHLEAIGAPLWRLVEPLGRRLLPVQRPVQALLYGFFWGFLPCGLVYAVLVIAFTLPGPLGGAQAAAAFWLGSLPAMLAAGMFTTALRRLLHRPRLRLGVGLSLMVFGFAAPFNGALMPTLETCAGCMSMLP